MYRPLILFRCGWYAVPPNEEIYGYRHPPGPNIIQYWCTGGGFDYDTFVGIVAAPSEDELMSIISQDFLNVTDRGFTRLYDPNNINDRFQLPMNEWGYQRLAYLFGTGQLYTRPIVGHYSPEPMGPSWWCTTNIELFNV